MINEPFEHTSINVKFSVIVRFLIDFLSGHIILNFVDALPICPKHNTSLRNIVSPALYNKSLFIRNRNKFVFIIYLQIFYDFYTHEVCTKYVQMI